MIRPACLTHFEQDSPVNKHDAVTKIFSQWQHLDVLLNEKLVQLPEVDENAEV